jgi:hypothetical protein
MVEKKTGEKKRKKMQGSAQLTAVSSPADGVVGAVGGSSTYSCADS